MNPLVTLHRYIGRKGARKSLSIPSPLWDACWEALGHVWVWDDEFQKHRLVNLRFAAEAYRNSDHFLFKGILVFRRP